jgi:putative transposase
VVALHLDGWSVKAIASYLKVSRKTVYRVVGRWLKEGEDGLEDRPPGRPKGVWKVDLATMNDIRRMQENPELGAFRIRVALEQKPPNSVPAAPPVAAAALIRRQEHGRALSAR